MLEDLIYTKKSLGKEGKEIFVYKIRTMTSGEEITSFGRTLRKYWIDEIPQIYNVIRGDLRLVGIRPMSEKSWERYPKDIKDIALKEKPGLFGVGSQYSHNDKTFYLHLGELRSYLESRETNKVLSDLNQFFHILFNIFFRGVRSS